MISKSAAGAMQICSGQEAGYEAAIHFTYDVQQQDEIEKNMNWNATRKDVFIVAPLKHIYFC